MITTALLALPAVVVLGFILYRRPQNGLLLVAALVPLHGLLTIIPGGSGLTAWKEGVLLLTLLSTFVTPHRRTAPPPALPFWPVALAWAVLGTVSAFLTSGIHGISAVKITFFYLIVPLILWRAPFDARDRDRLVSILMGMGVLTALVGLAQQVMGADRLVELGYSYNEEIRLTGSLLRSFSTFTGPFAFGLFVMLSLVVGGAVALAAPRRRRNTLFLWCIPIMLLGMGVTVVRASYVGFAVGFLWLAIHRYRALFAGFAAAAVALPIVLIVTPSSVTRSLFSSSSLGERSDGWSSTFASLLEHPLGQGLGATGSAAARAAEQANPLMNEMSMYAAIQLGIMPYQPDNYYMKSAVELGPIGLFLVVLILVTAVVWPLRASRALTGQDSALALGVSAAGTAAVVASVFATYFEIFPLDFYFWLLLGTVGCALSQHLEDHDRNPARPSSSVRWRSAPAAEGSRPTSANSSGP